MRYLRPIVAMAFIVTVLLSGARAADAEERSWTVHWHQFGFSHAFTVSLPAGDFGSVRSPTLTGTCTRPPASSKLQVWAGFNCRGEGKYVAFDVKASAKPPDEVHFSYVVDSYGGATFLFVLANDGVERHAFYSIKGGPPIKSPVRYRTTVHDSP